MRRTHGKIWRNSGVNRGDKFKIPDTGINMHLPEGKDQGDILCTASAPGQEIMTG